MSAKDSTGDKLVASIRKTKARAAAGGGKAAAAESTPAPKKKAAGKAAARRPATVKSAVKKPAATRAGDRAKPPITSNKPHSVDPFQRGRRVWPD